MKNLIIYYLQVFIPAIILFGLFKTNKIDFSEFIILFLIYGFVYRMFIDYYRLKSKNLIEKKDFWKLLIPGARIKYFFDLFFI